MEPTELYRPSDLLQLISHLTYKPSVQCGHLWVDERGRDLTEGPPSHSRAPVWWLHSHISDCDTEGECASGVCQLPDWLAGPACLPHWLYSLLYSTARCTVCTQHTILGTWNDKDHKLTEEISFHHRDIRMIKVKVTKISKYFGKCFCGLYSECYQSINQN